MVRSAIVILVLFLLFIVTIPILLINKLYYLITKRNLDYVILFVIHFLLKSVIFFSGIKAEYIDFEKLPKNKAVLFIANHQSIFDIVFTYPLFKIPTGYIAKKELKKIPVVRTIMEAANCLFLDRKNLKEGMKTVIAAIQKIKSGIPMVVFPEGTVNKTGHPEIIQDFKEGSLKIAQKANCLIVPIVIANTNSVFEKQKPALNSKAKVILKCLNPIHSKDIPLEYQKNQAEFFRDMMQNELNLLYKKI